MTDLERFHAKTESLSAESCRLWERTQQLWAESQRLIALGRPRSHLTPVGPSIPPAAALGLALKHEEV